MDKYKVNERNKLINKSMKEFKFIKKNIYINRKKYLLKDEDAYICDCKKPQVKKGQDISKLSEDDLFGCGHRCSNRRFQLQQHAYVYPVKTENRVNIQNKFNF